MLISLFEVLREHLSCLRCVPASFLRLFINPIVARKFIFVVGPPRCGTTILHRLLLNHPKTVGFEEETDIISLRSVYVHSRFSALIDPATHKRILRESWGLSDFLVRMHEVCLPATTDMSYVEKTPQHSKHITFLLRHFPNSRIVFIVRDPRDAFVSARSSNFIPQARSPKDFAKYYKRCVKSLMHLIETDDFDSFLFLVRYEDLTVRTTEVMNEINQFCGLERFPNQINVAASGADRRAAHVNFRRLGEPITASTVGIWKSALDHSDAALITAVLEREMEVLGYDR